MARKWNKVWQMKHGGYMHVIYSLFQQSLENVKLPERFTATTWENLELSD